MIAGPGGSTNTFSLSDLEQAGRDALAGAGRGGKKKKGGKGRSKEKGDGKGGYLGSLLDIAANAKVTVIKKGDQVYERHRKQWLVSVVL